MEALQMIKNRFLVGQVVQGKQLGRTIEFPTANLEIKQDVASLRNGVYGVYVYYQEKRFVGMMNVGSRPTFDNGNHQTYEVHILDFANTIYQEQLIIEIMFYIRSERKFQRLQDLVQQLHADVFHTRKQFQISF